LHLPLLQMADSESKLNYTVYLANAVSIYPRENSDTQLLLTSPVRSLLQYKITGFLILKCYIPRTLSKTGRTNIKYFYNCRTGLWTFNGIFYSIKNVQQRRIPSCRAAASKIFPTECNEVTIRILYKSVRNGFQSQSRNPLI
jgi:hypothetical protein